jgi:Carboxypeptidase regulatory-like domain
MRHTLILATAFLLSAAAAFSQTITGSITGTVMDPSGAAIPGARITATNLSTNLSTTVASNSAGVYNLLFLPIGTYRLEVEAANFKKIAMGPFALETDQIARVDPKMEVGQTTQTVEVQGVAPILQTEATQTGGLISGAVAS